MRWMQVLPRIYQICVSVAVACIRQSIESQHVLIYTIGVLRTLGKFTDKGSLGRSGDKVHIVVLLQYGQGWTGRRKYCTARRGSRSRQSTRRSMADMISR